MILLPTLLYCVRVGTGSMVRETRRVSSTSTVKQPPRAPRRDFGNVAVFVPFFDFLCFTAAGGTNSAKGFHAMIIVDAFFVLETEKNKSNRLSPFPIASHWTPTTVLLYMKFWCVVATRVVEPIRSLVLLHPYTQTP